MSEPGQDPVVLIVDDSDDDRFFFRVALKKAGVAARLFSAEDGEEAIQFLSHTGRFSNAAESPSPDYIFLDLKMPGRNGFEVLEWIKGQPAPISCPVLILSGSHEPADMQRSRELGAADYIIKPITPKKLREVLFTQG